MVLKGRATLRLLGRAECARDGIGEENVNTKVGTTQLLGLPEAEGVAVAGLEDAKPVPEAANDEAWAASWLELLAGGTETPPELAMLVGTVQAGVLAICWAESTCWMVLATAARKAADVGKTTHVEDGAVEATLDADGADTNSAGISSDSCAREKALYAADWLLQVFLVFIIFLVSRSAKTVRESAKIR